ncbi:phage portal protein [Schleiferilactobacillus harbinensis]|uniref:phage portal protein n=1 Tax=Schleiferilactobacillus harbinensis TaxID=304207 RepID=UPI0021A78957|nr:phage portal protein [Schleiferilactobacillus harbinensis]MCT2909553.1 phage portal protein [Schleiferilactobacillus harbinensis]
MNPFSRFQRRSQIIPASNFNSFVFQNGQIVPNNLVDAQSALHNSDVFAVINLIASDVASAKFSIADPFAKLMANPNGLISGYNFWQSVVAQLLLTGNAYVAVTRGTNNIPTNLELAPAGQITVTLGDKSASISYQVNWNDERGTVSYTSQNMLHFRLLAAGNDATKSYVGISPLESLVNAVNMQEYSSRLTLGTLKNAINPMLTITVPEAVLKPEEKENIRDSYLEQSGGANTGKPIVLDQSSTLNALSINADVAKFLSTLDFGKTAISEAFGVPANYLNGQGDQQSSLDMVKSLYSNTLRRYTMPIESEISDKFGVTCDLDESSAVDADNSTLISQIQQLLAGTTPAITPEQAQQMLQKRGVI